MVADQHDDAVAQREAQVAHEGVRARGVSPLPSGSRLIDTPAPVAYCLPGTIGSVTVVSAGLVALLDEAGMRAVIEHEKAHVRQRHDVVLVLFRAWYASLPWFPIAYRAQREVALLVELADDHARRTVDDAVLSDAIVRAAALLAVPTVLLFVPALLDLMSRSIL